MRIYYVEDNPANVALLQRIARIGGHEIIYYNDGETALERFEREQPHLVLMDLQLAGKLSGLDVVRVLRERGVKTPIVALTAYAMVGDRDRCLEAGCDGYMAKPLPVTDVVELIARYATQASETPASASASGTAASSKQPAPDHPDETSPATPALPPAARAAASADPPASEAKLPAGEAADTRPDPPVSSKATPVQAARE
jgi:CheY-like chemotaxis protein